MKKQTTVYILTVLVLIVISCSRKAVTMKDLPPSATSAPATPAPVMATVEAAPADAATLASGKAVYETKCIRCHALKPTMSFTQPHWEGILKIMVPKANLTASEAQQVAAYVKANAKR